MQERKTRRETMGDNRRQDLGKAETLPNSKRKQEGVQWETRGDKTSGRRQEGAKKGRNGRQRETNGETKEDQTCKKADTP